MAQKQRMDVVQTIIDHYGYTDYLELGYGKGWTFESVKCQNKTAVESDNRYSSAAQKLNPIEDGKNIFNMTTDEFFESHAHEYRFDIIFIDADHTKEQVKIDIQNSLEVIDSKGTVVLHDMNPPDGQHLGKELCGDGWEAFAKLRTTRKDLNMFTVPDDCGVGVIQKGSQELYKGEIESGWNFFSENREEVMNIVEFNKITENLV